MGNLLIIFVYIFQVFVVLGKFFTLVLCKIMCYTILT